jgi:uncharacterized protein YhbP (UPF0306 family)
LLEAAFVFSLHALFLPSCYDKSHMRFTNTIAHNAAGALLDKPVSEEQVRRAVLDILEANPLCSMSTVTPDDRAHINTAYFCYSGELEFYFLSHPRSTHCQNVAANSSMAMAIFSSKQEWLGPDRGVQLFGTAIQAESTEASKAEELYAKRFSAYRNWKSTGLGELESEYRFYRFVALRLKVLDDVSLGDAVFVSATVDRK